jgi:SAM-dependent methyltransferase
MIMDARRSAADNAGSAVREIEDHAAKVRENALLEEIYRDIYARIAAEVPIQAYPRVLEIGSGGGFFREFAPHAVTSECVAVPGIDRVIDACRIADHLDAGSFDAIVAFNVFHHLPDAAGFLRGASRVLRPGGRLALVEPWFTPIGQWFYRVIHPEPSILDPSDWRVVGEGRLGGANTRLPTSVFRDGEERFAREFPDLFIVRREPFHKWLYLLSGGLRLNTRVPRALARGFVRLDREIAWGNASLGLFALVIVERKS